MSGDVSKNPVVFRKLSDVLGVFEGGKNSELSQSIGVLLQRYNTALNNFHVNYKKDLPKKAFIVLEGLDGSGKSTITKKLCKKHDAQLSCTPPESVKDLRPIFDEHPKFRTAFYCLGNYIAALETNVILQSRNVIMDRYWHSTSAYAISQAVHDFPLEVVVPPVGDEFYSFPDDLLKPDIIIFLDVTEKVRRERISRRRMFTPQENLIRSNPAFRDNIIQVYKNFHSPKVTFVDGNGGFGANMGLIGSHIHVLCRN